MEKLVAHLYQTTWNDFHADTIEAAKLVILDTIAAIVAGVEQEATLKLTEMLANQDAGNFRIIGSSHKTTLYHAALIHGTASVATEMDEGNQYSKGHPAAHVVPVLLTYAQNRDRYSGKAFLEATIKAYEACSRFGRASTLVPDAHAHGTWGTLGAAAAACLMDQVSEEQFMEGIRLGATFALPTMWEAALNGCLVRNIYAGHAVEAGIKITALLQSGHYAPSNNVEHVFSKMIGTEWNSDELTPSHDGVWDIERNYFKPYAFCRYAHAPIDAFKEAIEANRLAPEQIRQVEVYTYARAATLSSSDYHNILSAKFSIPYALGMWAHHQLADESAFSNAFINDPDIRAFAKKVKVIHSKELDREYPKIMPAVIRIIDEQGNTHESRIDMAEGGPGKELNKVALQEKFNRLTQSVFSERRRQQIFERIMDLEHVEDIEDLISLCVKEKVSS